MSMGNHLNSAAIALLALAVIFLAIKEPKCDPPQGSGRAAAPAAPAAPAQPRPPRELRKF
ncbi:MAG: hypothetical protein ACJ0GR_04885 [Prochlorococcaceae cyanobacterium]